jgi:D-alanyl-D-alanine carboxypeptidase
MGGQSARLRDAKMAQLLNDGFANKFGKVMVAKAEEPAAAETADDDQAEPSAASRAVAALSPVGTAQAAPIAARKVAEVPGDAWSIQLGAFSKHGAAEKAAHAASKLAVAKGKPLQIIAPSKDDKERLYRVRLVNFTKHEADQACTLLHRKHQKCSLVAPTPVKVART